MKNFHIPAISSDARILSFKRPPFILSLYFYEQLAYWSVHILWRLETYPLSPLA